MGATNPAPNSLPGNQLANFLQLIRGSTSELQNIWLQMDSTTSGIGSMIGHGTPLVELLEELSIQA